MKQKLIHHLLQMVALMALTTAVTSVQATCPGLYYQPKVPESLLK